MKKRTYDKAFYQKLWGLMIPIVLQNLMLALVAVADAFMLGGMNQNYMSAVSPPTIRSSTTARSAVARSLMEY